MSMGNAVFIPWPISGVLLMMATSPLGVMLIKALGIKLVAGAVAEAVWATASPTPMRSPNIKPPPARAETLIKLRRPSSLEIFSTVVFIAKISG